MAKTESEDIGGRIEALFAGSAQRFAYLELVQARSHFLKGLFGEHLGPKLVTFDPAQQDAFVRGLHSRNWLLVTGQFSAAVGPARSVYERCTRFTVVQDPIERFAAHYEIARTVVSHPKHEFFKGLDILAAARWEVEHSGPYGRNSQCASLTWDASVAPDFSNALSFCQDAMAFCGTTRQRVELLAFLRAWDLVLPHVAEIEAPESPELDARTRAGLLEVLKEGTDEDRKLFDYFAVHGPCTCPAENVPGIRSNSAEGRTRCLVYGFSVTGDTPGYFEAWQREYESLYPGLAMSKVGIGGLQPYHARHLLRDILSRRSPDILLVEIATAIHRLQPASAAICKSHIETLEATFDLCREHGIKCGILDLPQLKVDSKRDWMYPIHAELAARFGVARMVVDLRDGVLKDNVHPNEEGKLLYADALKALVDEVLVRPVPCFEELTCQRRFDSYSVTQLEADGGEHYLFRRNGFETMMIRIREGERVTFRMPSSKRIVGLIVSMGPTTGLLEVTINGKQEAVACFDMHCYYFRVGGRSIGPSRADVVEIRQSEQFPSTELASGRKNTGPRLGGITHILFEDDIQ